MNPVLGRRLDIALAGAGLVLLLLTLRQYRFYGPVEAAAVTATGSRIAAETKIQSARDYLQSHPEDFNAWTALAIACYQKGPEAYVEGLNALDKARKLGATGPALFWYAGVMFQALDLPDYAINELEKYQRHFPHHPETQVRLAQLYWQAKRPEEAWALYQRLQREYPNDPVIQANYEAVAAFIRKQQEKNALSQAGKK